MAEFLEWLDLTVDEQSTSETEQVLGRLVAQVGRRGTRVTIP
ncbi:hypothetical protein [Modestobacter altitudinis]|nr:hypothetical protein [Modestobacter altitudinis]